VRIPAPGSGAAFGYLMMGRDDLLIPLRDLAHTTGRRPSALRGAGDGEDGAVRALIALVSSIRRDMPDRRGSAGAGEDAGERAGFG